MSDPTLFDLPTPQVSERDLDAGRVTRVREHERVVRPRARRTDPSASHEAASVVEGSNRDLVEMIRAVVWGRCLTQFDIAAEVQARRPGVWQSDTIRTACARAGLVMTRKVRVEGRRYSVSVWTVDGEGACACREAAS